MNLLRLFFFAEFALIALAVPVWSIHGRLILPRLGRVLGVVVALLAPLLGAVHTWLPEQSLLTIAVLQLLAAAFAVAVCGLALLAGRFWMWGGPVVVTLAALAVLATPFWNSLLLNARQSDVASAARQGLVVVNPLFTVAADLGQFDWMHTPHIYRNYGAYKLTRLGEDFPYRPARAWLLAIVYAAVGLVSSGAAGLLRPRGRPNENVLGRARFC